ncbi:MAG TPA: carbohydrate porin [Acidobacteriaceae bacterium]|nr:carbohydrate porin [Acidobacteriaceae bacterium]
MAQTTDAKPTATAADASPTVFPHHDADRWYIGGQANIIFQAHGPFHSPYQGANSLLPRGEYKTSLLGTLYLGLQPHRNLRYNTDLIYDEETAGGRGMSEALGLAGAPNLDVVRNPNLGSMPYLARMVVHQTIGLTNEMVDADRDITKLSLATRVPARHIDLYIGKMSLPDVFDQNSVASDSHLQFTNWTVDNNAAWDYGAETRGYTYAAIAEYDDRLWSVRYAIATMSTVANGPDLDYALRRANGQNMEFELRPTLLAKRKTVVRVLSYVNHAHMGNYREAVQQYQAHLVTTPVISLSERNGAVKYGFGANFEQELTDNLRIAGRFGWDDGRNESYEYTEVDQTVELAADYAFARWHRPNDKVGLAFVSNAIKKDHQNYLHDGGLGFLLGDGNLNYGRENIVEGYYNAHMVSGIYAALGFQAIDDPGYNRDRGPVFIEAVRVHIDF